MPAGDYAAGDRAAALAAFEIAGGWLRLAGAELARRMLQASTEALADLVSAVAGQHRLTGPTLVAVGGGAGVFGALLADALGLAYRIPPGAEVISSVGDALSLVRAERERTMSHPTPADVDALIAEVEAEALAAGAAPNSLQVQVSRVGERGATRAVAVGALVLGSGVVPGRPPLDRAGIAAAARAAGCAGHLEEVGAYWLCGDPPAGRVLLLDRFGDPVLDVRGEALLVEDGQWLDGTIEPVVARHLRHVGPVTVQPTTWVVQDCRVRELEGSATVGAALGTGRAAVIVGRD